MATNKLWTSMVRQASKLAQYADMYGPSKAAFGAKLHQNITDSNTHSIARTHPLEYMSGYSFKGRDARFGNVPVYKAATKIISEIIMKKEKVPHTECYFRHFDELNSVLSPNVAAIAWVRRLPLAEIEQAVATLIMMGKEPVVVRAFEP